MNRIFVLIGFSLLLSPRFLAASQPDDLYKEAQLQESTARDPEAAIKLYEAFLKQPATDRSKQAGAYLHLGLCHAKIGRREPAKIAWKKVVQDYSDQSETYSQALNQLQQIQLAERAEVHASSPIVKVVKVYEDSPARWMVEFPRGTYLRALDGKGRLVDTAAGGSLGFVHFPEPDLGAGMEFGSIGASGPPSARRDIGYFMILARKEKPLVSGLKVYAKAGTGLYFFKFTNSQKSESKTTIGASLEGGFVIGMPRGFAFNFGYLFHVFAQSTPSADFDNTIPTADRPDAAEVTQNRGFRLVGGPDVSLSFRW